MQSVIRPTGAYQCRHFDVLKGRPFRCPVLIVQRVSVSLSQKVFLHLKPAIPPAFDAHIPKKTNELRLRNSSMKREFAVQVRDTLPRNDCAQMKTHVPSSCPLRPMGKTCDAAHSIKCVHTEDLVSVLNILRSNKECYSTGKGQTWRLPSLVVASEH